MVYIFFVIITASILSITITKNKKINIGVIKFIDIMAETTISVSKKFHDWLKSKGKKGESYEDVIKKMLKPEYLKELEGYKVSQEPEEPEESEGF